MAKREEPKNFCYLYLRGQTAARGCDLTIWLDFGLFISKEEKKIFHNCIYMSRNIYLSICWNCAWVQSYNLSHYHLVKWNLAWNRSPSRSQASHYHFPLGYFQEIPNTCFPRINAISPPPPPSPLSRSKHRKDRHPKPLLTRQTADTMINFHSKIAKPPRTTSCSHCSLSLPLRKCSLCWLLSRLTSATFCFGCCCGRVHLAPSNAAFVWLLILKYPIHPQIFKHFYILMTNFY